MESLPDLTPVDHLLASFVSPLALRCARASQPMRTRKPYHHQGSVNGRLSPSTTPVVTTVRFLLPLEKGYSVARRSSATTLGGTVSEANKPYGYQPYAGSTWATNNDAGIAYNIARRRAQGLPDFDAVPPTRGQVVRRAVLARMRLTTSSVLAAVLAVLFLIAGFSVIASHTLSGIVGIVIGGALGIFAVRRQRRARRLWAQKIDGL
jgi:hypothetical protein